jgi:hypothetical protein
MRHTDCSPRPGELIIPLIIWSWVFEIILPGIDGLGDRFIADHLDILYYSLGALLAGLFWKSFYNSRRRVVDGGDIFDFH